MISIYNNLYQKLFFYLILLNGPKAGDSWNPINLCNKVNKTQLHDCNTKLLTQLSFCKRISALKPMCNFLNYIIISLGCIFFKSCFSEAVQKQFTYYLEHEYCFMMDLGNVPLYANFNFFNVEGLWHLGYSNNEFRS